MSDNTMTWVQALVRLWDRDPQGYTMQEVAREAGWEVDDQRDFDPDGPPQPWALAASHAVVDGLAVPTWGYRGDQRRALFTPVLA